MLPLVGGLLDREEPRVPQPSNPSHSVRSDASAMNWSRGHSLKRKTSSCNMSTVTSAGPTSRRKRSGDPSCTQVPGGSSAPKPAAAAPARESPGATARGVEPSVEDLTTARCRRCLSPGRPVGEAWHHPAPTPTTTRAAPTSMRRAPHLRRSTRNCRWCSNLKPSLSPQTRRGSRRCLTGARRRAVLVGTP